MLSMFKTKKVQRSLQEESDLAIQSFTETIDKLEDISKRATESAENAYNDANELLKKEEYYRRIADNNLSTVAKLKQLFTI